jgi:flagellar biosynthesis chaperone FliJ
MKRYPLQTLIHLRELRTQRAQLELLHAQRILQDCRAVCSRIEAEIDGLINLRAEYRAQLANPSMIEPVHSFGLLLAQREAHTHHLASLIEAAGERLEQACAALRQAELEYEASRQILVRAKARQEAMEKRKSVWQRELSIAATQREENTAAELTRAHHHLTQTL